MTKHDTKPWEIRPVVTYREKQAKLNELIDYLNENGYHVTDYTNTQLKATRLKDRAYIVYNCVDSYFHGGTVEEVKATMDKVKIERPTQDEYFMDMAELVSRRSTCVRRRVGCVLINDRKHVLATGYNGVASGMPHCIDSPCSGASYPSGEGLDKCEAIHAEQNALLQCRDVYEITTAYCTTPPCITCVKLLMNTGCAVIVTKGEYPQADEAKALWKKNGGCWVNL